MLKIMDTTNVLDTYLAMDLFSEDTKERVKNADVIFIPDIGKIEGIEKAFRPDTKIFYKFIKEQESLDKKFEILENEGELNVLNFHSHEVWLPVMYIRDKALLLTILEMVNKFILEKKRKTDELVINFNVHVENKEHQACKILSFKGSLDDLNEAIKTLDLTIF